MRSRYRNEWKYPQKDTNRAADKENDALTLRLVGAVFEREMRRLETGDKVARTAGRDLQACRTESRERERDRLD